MYCMYLVMLRFNSNSSYISFTGIVSLFTKHGYSIRSGMRIIKGERAETGIGFSTRGNGAHHALHSIRTGLVLSCQAWLVLCTTESAWALATLASSESVVVESFENAPRDIIGCSDGSPIAMDASLSRPVPESLRKLVLIEVVLRSDPLGRY